MSKLPKIVRDLTGRNYVIDEDLKRMIGKTVKTVRWGTGESVRGGHQSEVLHIEFTDGEILAIDTGSNVRQFRKKVPPEDVRIDFMFRWEPETPKL